MISLKEYQDALKVVEEYRKQQYKILLDRHGIKEKTINSVNIDPIIYAEKFIYNIYMPSFMYKYLRIIGEYELPKIHQNELKIKHFAGLSKTQLLKYRAFGKRKLEILEYHLSFAGLHLEP